MRAAARSASSARPVPVLELGRAPGSASGLVLASGSLLASDWGVLSRWGPGRPPPASARAEQRPRRLPGAIPGPIRRRAGALSFCPTRDGTSSPVTAWAPRPSLHMMVLPRALAAFGAAAAARADV